MAFPGLKDFNRLIDSAQHEIEAWSKTPAAAAVPASRLHATAWIAITQGIYLVQPPHELDLHNCFDFLGLDCPARFGRCSCAVVCSGLYNFAGRLIHQGYGRFISKVGHGLTIRQHLTS